MLFWIAQGVSVFTIIFTIVALLQKEKFKMMIYFTITNVALLSTYFLLGRYLSVILVFGATVRTFVYYIYAVKNKKPNTIVAVFFEVYFVLVSLLFWKDYFDLFMLANLTMLTYTTWQDNMRTLRLGYVFSAILLLTYDIAVGAYVSAISEAIVLVTSLISIYKYDIKNTVKDVVLHFYRTIAPSYSITIENKDKYYSIISKDIDDVFNNFAYIQSPLNFQPALPQIRREFKKQNRTPALYFQSIDNKEMHHIMQLSKMHPLLFRDVWMKLRSGQNPRYKKCLLEGVTYLACGEEYKNQIIKLFRDGFIDTVGEDIYKYSDSYAEKYEKILTNEYLKKYDIHPYLAFYQGKPISLLFMYRNNYNAYLCQVTTLKKYRQNGVASALIRYAVGQERKSGIQEFYLVSEKYTHLEAFYMKNNFEEISQGICLDFSKDKIKKTIQY